MYDWNSFLLFLGTAIVIAATPGSAIMYVAARTLAGGRREGIASTLGTAVGGSVHIIASGLGLSALLLASATAFTIVKFAGAAYLIWLAVQMWRSADEPLDANVEAAGTAKAFRDGIVVEILNPKVAGFFFAFLPQFIDPARPVFFQVAVLGAILITLNSLADLVVITLAGRARDGLLARPRLIERLRKGSAVIIFLLGTSLLLARRPQV